MLWYSSIIAIGIYLYNKYYVLNLEIKSRIRITIYLYMSFNNKNLISGTGNHMQKPENHTYIYIISLHKFRPLGPPFKFITGIRTFKTEGWIATFVKSLLLVQTY